MRKSVRAALLGTAVTALITGSAAVYAASEYSSGSMMSDGMMGHSMGAGGMMLRMSRMMDGCNAMMQGGSRSGRPNEQWRHERSNTDRDR